MSQNPTIRQFSPFEELPAEISTEIYRLIAIQQSEASQRPCPKLTLHPKSNAVSYGEQCIAWQHVQSQPRHPPRIQLRTLQLSSLAGTSHKIRREFIPEFFSAAKFIITIGLYVNFTQHSHSSPKPLVSDLLDAVQGAADPQDPILLTAPVETLLGKWHEEALFQDVHFCLHGKDRDWSHESRKSWEVVALRLLWRGGVLKTETSFEENGEGKNKEAMSAAVECATELTEREGFEGFTVSDLRHVAVSLVI